jgi:hypothetical protein
MLSGEEAHLEGMTSLNGNSLDRFRNHTFFPCREIGSHPICASPSKKCKLHGGIKSAYETSLFTASEHQKFCMQILILLTG